MWENGFVTPFCKNWKTVKWYGGIVQNLGTITQILAGLCTFNYVQFSAVFHLLIQKCLEGSFFSGHTVYISIFGNAAVLIDFGRNPPHLSFSTATFKRLTTHKLREYITLWNITRWRFDEVFHTRNWSGKILRMSAMLMIIASSVSPIR